MSSAPGHARIAPDIEVFDGDRGICRTWVDYWGKLTGDQVGYRPYQEGGKDFPQIPLPEFQRAMQLIEPDGTVYAGAAATFRLLTFAPARGWWWWLYRYLPGFALLSEAAYSCLSQRRGLLAKPHPHPLGSHARARVLRARDLAFLRGLGAIYLAPSSRSACRS